MKLRIPKRYKLGNIKHHVAEVRQLSAVEDPELNVYGEFDEATNTIRIVEGLSDDKAGHTFCHELTHTILNSMNHPLNEDEAFVDTFALFLHQFLTTQSGILRVCSPE